MNTESKALRRSSLMARFALLAMAAAATTHSGCDCNAQVQSGCVVDDDCRAYKCQSDEIPICQGGACGCTPDVSLGDVGRFSSMAMRGGTAYVSAYNNTYGDLMIGHVAPPGRIDNWEFVDGVPELSPENPLSKVRGGVTDPGDDVGRYTSIAITPDGDPVVAYYDVTHGTLKYAQFSAIKWYSQVVDHGVGSPASGGDDIGKYASLSLDKTGAPGIAYYAEVDVNGVRTSQLKFAQAKIPYPRLHSDWDITVVDQRAMPTPDPMSTSTPILPEGNALFISLARKTSNDAPAMAYYDRVRGNLVYVEYDPSAKMWKTPVILDGEDAMGGDTGDVGWYPSLTFDKDDTAHISYEDASHDDLLYVNTKTMTPEVVDDGYRPMDEQTLDGLDSPVYHLVGDSSSIQVDDKGTIYVAYQDSTVLQLRLAVKDPMTGKWKLETLAGHGSPFTGSYGFYAQNKLSGGTVVISSYAINQHLPQPDYFVEVFGVSTGVIF